MAWATYTHATLDDLEIWVVDTSADDADTDDPRITYPGLAGVHEDGAVVTRVAADNSEPKILDSVPSGYTAS